MDIDLMNHGAVSYDTSLSGIARDLPDNDLSDHGAVSYDTSLSGIARDLPDIDLSDHGAVSYDTSLSGIARDLPDIDLSDHGAVSYDTSLSGIARDLPDIDLSDHGAVTYESKKETWGTNEQDMITQIDILMHASYSANIDKVVPMLAPESLTKIVEYRYHQIANVLDDEYLRLSNNDKEDLGKKIYMDFLLINKMITSNPSCLQPIFDVNLYAGNQDRTNIYGVLSQYQQDFNKAGINLPLINASTRKPVVDEVGNSITAQDMLAVLMSTNKEYVSDIESIKTI